jgi:uncharacterized membrane protein
MNGTDAEPEYHIAKNRLETLIDGIFAIAMTLLVLTVAIPKPSAELAPAVLPGLIFDLFPQLFLCIVAFLVLAVFWLGHHRQFHFVQMVDPTLLWINIFLLIFIVLIPFSTDIAGDYSDVAIAVLSFHVNVLIVGLFFCLHWHHISSSPHLCGHIPGPSAIRARYLETALIPAVAFLAILVTFIDPSDSLLVYFIAPIPYYLLNHFR